MKKRIPILILILAGVAGLVYWRLQNTAFTYAGTVEATEVDVASQVSSTLASLGAAEGQAVTLGQTLATFTGEDYKLAQGLAQDDYSRALWLYKSGGMSQEAYNHLKSQKELADLRVKWCTVASPLTGTVLVKYHEPGEWVNVGARLFTLADLREVWCLVYVPQPMLGKISLGQKVTAIYTDSPGKVFGGTITHIGNEAEFTPKNVQTRQERTRLVYAVKASFPNDGGFLKPGMTLEVQLPK